MTLHRRLHDLYTQHRDRLFAYALSLTGDREAAEDAVHTAIVRILGNGAEPVELAPYLYRSVRNAAVDEHRRARRFAGGTDEVGDAVAAGVVLDRTEARDLTRVEAWSTWRARWPSTRS